MINLRLATLLESGYTIRYIFICIHIQPWFGRRGNSNRPWNLRWEEIPRSYGDIGMSRHPEESLEPASPLKSLDGGILSDCNRTFCLPFVWSIARIIETAFVELLGHASLGLCIADGFGCLWRVGVYYWWRHSTDWSRVVELKQEFTDDQESCGSSR
jgi:hypothetical protein